MKKNMGTADRVIRVLLVILVAVLYFTDLITGTAAIILGVVALILLITSLTGFCGLYKVIGVSTGPKKESEGN